MNERIYYVVFDVSNCYWGWFSIQLDNESTSVFDSRVQVLLLVVADFDTVGQ